MVQMIKPVKAGASAQMLEVADVLQGVCDAIRGGKVSAVAVVVVERGPDKNVTRIKCIDDSISTLIGGIELAKVDVMRGVYE